MSLSQKAAHGALWMVLSSIGGRAAGVLGTLVITRFLRPSDIGEVSDAAILCMTANWVTSWGFGQYCVVKGREQDEAEVTWHATVAYIVSGAISIGLIALLGSRLTSVLSAPHAAIYVPGMALAFFIRRFGAIPERILTRQMSFRASALSLAVGETIYTVVALTLASLGWGGMSIVVANIVQSSTMVFILIRAAGIRSWTTTPLRWRRFKDMLRFGLPLGIQGIAHNASRYWDNLAISHFFGPGATGAYNMAYNLADIPAIQVGEQIALVLLPSMAGLPHERRARALERSSALLSLIIFPLAVGLGLVAQPLIATVLPANKWQEVGPLLEVLACLSVFRPITWVLSAYMEAEQKTSRLMVLEIGKVGVLLAGIALLQRYGVRTAAASVGIAFGATAIGGVVLVMREGPSPARLLVGFVQPLIACGIMASVVWLVHRGLVAAHLRAPGATLAVEVVAGAIAYVVAALIVARESSRDLLRLLKQA